ncbi:MAG: hypothetical protein HC819_15745 [Cyclobacteriaceae bacterium]|nr:hypothetical protein [Cyclobacteriaceae bacterium]
MSAIEGALLLKLMTGSFRSPVSQHLVTLAIAALLDVRPAMVRLRLSCISDRQTLEFDALRPEVPFEQHLLPLEFPHIESIATAEEIRGEVQNLTVYGYEDGIVAQLVKWGDRVEIWLSESELATASFPEIVKCRGQLPHALICWGRIVPKNPQKPLHLLLSRLGKKHVGLQDIQLAEAKFIINEVWGGDLDHETMAMDQLAPAKALTFGSLEALHVLQRNCRAMGFSGLLIRESGKKNPWQWWKANAYSVRAVLMHVALGQRQIAAMTLGVWHQDTLLPIAKIIEPKGSIHTRELMDYVKNNTIEKFGPVRSLKPGLVYVLHFDAVQQAPRRKAGLALINTEIDRLVGDDPGEADALDTIWKLV